MLPVYEIINSPQPYHNNRYVTGCQLSGSTHTGFTSHFGYLGLQTGDKPVRGQTLLYCDMLVIDLDSLAESVSKLSDLLISLKIGHTAWMSGSKGVHFHIPIKPIQGMYIDQWVKNYVTTTLGHIYGVDTSIYNLRGLIRLPGTVHARTGKRKALIDSYVTDTLLTVPETPAVLPKIYHEPSNPIEALYLAVGALSRSIKYPPNPGQRHHKLWHLGRLLFEAGLDYDTGVKLVLMTQLQWNEPKSEEDVLKALEGIW